MPSIEIPNSKWDEWPDVEPHMCHFCGTEVIHGYEHDGTRHYLSDCRPDLVEHEQGKFCTWHSTPGQGGCEHDLSRLLNQSDLDEHLENCVRGCYAFQNRDTNEWTEEHVHFDSDGPM